jgi:hemoglobin/transferrin/lactoferrin receptor protein
MKIFKYVTVLLFAFQHTMTYSQNTVVDTAKTKVVSLDDIVISANKVEETKRNVAQQVQTISAKEIQISQSQSTADLISNTGTVFVQKSQMGGGSPVLRGFEANHILLVIDGVRMNNLIYRSGHLQDIMKTDNNSLDRVEILFGPSSTIYGSDALGGVIHLYTKKPLFAAEVNNPNIKLNAFSRYGSVNKEMTGHIDFNYGSAKFASITSFTYSKFDDLKGGKNQNPFYSKSFGERPFYVERINGKDSLVKNQDRYLQVQSGFSQYDLLQKFAFKQGDHVVHGLNIQFSNSTDVPRYDRLTDPEGTGLKSAEWYYGPQKRLMAAYDFTLNNNGLFFQNIHFGLNGQQIEESRHTRSFGSDFINHRIEKVNVIGANLDFRKTMLNHSLRLGADIQLNDLTSTASRENIVTGSIGKLSTRFPDGDNTMNNYAAYISHTWIINENITLTDGIRAGYSTLYSTLKDSTTLPDPLPAVLPYTSIEQNTPVYSGSIGVIHSPTEDLKLALIVATGFRVPNLDDVTKLFDPSPGTVIVPNNKLEPEKTVNYELSVTNIIHNNSQWENTVYYTQLSDAITIADFKYNGADSILYDGQLSRVTASQNKEKAYIYGFSSNFKSQLNKHLSLGVSLSYTYGRIKTDSSDYPLGHIPPFMMQMRLNYNNAGFDSGININYNGWKRPSDYNLGGEDNEQYATPDGMPAWITAKVHFGYKVCKLISIQAGIDNIFDTQYRTFASGINAPGRNVYATLRFHY